MRAAAGRLVREPLPAPRHGRIAVKLGARLDAFAERHGLGLVFNHTGFALYRDPDTVRGPDLSFVTTDRVPSTGYAGSFWRMAPDLAIESLSQSNRQRQTLEEVNEYLDTGSRLVWVVDPKRRPALHLQSQVDRLMQRASPRPVTLDSRVGRALSM